MSASYDFIFIKDVAPTILEFAGVEHPGTRFDGRSIESMTGTSIMSTLRGAKRPDSDRVTGIEIFGKRAIRSGDWKLVHMPEPYGIDDWQLFNVKDDISESRDLSGEFPDKVQELKFYWEDYEERTRSLFPTG